MLPPFYVYLIGPKMHDCMSSNFLVALQDAILGITSLCYFPITQSESLLNFLQCGQSVYHVILNKVFIPLKLKCV